MTLLLTILATTLFTAEGRPKTSVETWLDRFQACCITLTIIPIVETILVFRFFNMIKSVMQFWNNVLESEERKSKGEECKDLNDQERSKVYDVLDSMQSFVESRRRERVFTRWMVGVFKFEDTVVYSGCSTLVRAFHLFFKDGVVGPREVTESARAHSSHLVTSFSSALEI